LLCALEDPATAGAILLHINKIEGQKYTTPPVPYANSTTPFCSFNCTLVLTTLKVSNKTWSSHSLLGLALGLCQPEGREKRCASALNNWRYDGDKDKDKEYRSE